MAELALLSMNIWSGGAMVPKYWISNGYDRDGKMHPPTRIIDPGATLARAEKALAQATQDFQDAPRKSFGERDALLRMRSHQALVEALSGIIAP